MHWNDFPGVWMLTWLNLHVQKKCVLKIKLDMIFSKYFVPPVSLNWTSHQFLRNSWLYLFIVWFLMHMNDLPSAFQKVSALGFHLRTHYSVLFFSPNKYTGLEKLSWSNALDGIQSSHSSRYFLSVPKSQTTQTTWAYWALF